LAFLSLLDDRAKPKGSRDPLGFELVWTLFGRRVIGNLTTVTDSLTNFCVALLGCKWANELYPGGDNTERSQLVREAFLRFEQMSGYLRYLGDDGRILGVTRIGRRLAEGIDPIPLGLSTQAMILSDQGSYGLWGLYSTALRETGLITGDDRKPTPLGQSLAEEIEHHVDKQKLVSLMQRKGISKRDLQKQALPFSNALKHRTMRDKLLELLMNGSQRTSVQSELWRITRSSLRQRRRLESLTRYIETLRVKAKGTELDTRLEDIQATERLLVACNNVFNYLRRLDGEKLDTISQTLTDRYSYQHIDESLPLNSVPRGETLANIRTAFLTGDNTAVINQLIDLNAAVMRYRGGAAWVERETGNRLKVRIPSENAELLSQAELESHWDYDYFLNSYLGIASRELGASWKPR
jgi:hypothetical protein